MFREALRVCWIVRLDSRRWFNLLPKLLILPELRRTVKEDSLFRQRITPAVPSDRQSVER